MRQNDEIKIAVAMSGGVDSSTIAAILHEEHRVFGITMNLFDGSGETIESASRICRQLGIEHHIVDFRKDFKEKVMNVFAEYYSRGLTPNPCAICNRDIKLNMLLESARALGASRLATGHYAICEDGNLREARDSFKDQSYFLSLVTKEKLRFMDFPLGRIQNKDSTRQIARSLGLMNYDKKDSQDICFIHSTYQEFLRENYPNLKHMFDDGPVILQDTSKVLGMHHGFANYTIGQRRGLGVSYKEPLYVTNIDPLSKTVFVGTLDQSSGSKFRVRDVNWLVEKTSDFETYVKLRSFAKKVRVCVQKRGNQSVFVTLLERSNVPITPGQICAAYDKDGAIEFGGIIDSRAEL